MNRRGWLLAVVLGALLVGPVLAGPTDPCLQETLDLYLVKQSCGIGVFTVKDFSYLNEGVTIPASMITVQPFAGPEGPSLRFSSTAFSVVAGQKAVLTLGYNIDPPPIIIRGFEEEMFAETPVPPGLVRIDTALCVGGYFPGFCGGGDYDYGPLELLFLQLAHYGPNDPDNELRASVSFLPVNILGVSHQITLDATAGGSASFSALGNQAFIVPEPGTWLLLGCGLLGLAVLRRRRAG